MPSRITSDLDPFSPEFRAEVMAELPARRGRIAPEKLGLP